MMADTDLAVQRLERAQGARRPPRDGRLRHRLLVAELPEPVPGRHPQDGPLVPARRRVAGDVRPRHRGRRPRRDAQPRGRRRGHRARRAVARLRNLGCELGQGFLFARPMDADATLDYLRGRGQARSRPASADAPQLRGPRPQRRLQPRPAPRAAAPPRLPPALERHVRLAARRRRLPRRDGVAGVRAVERPHGARARRHRDDRADDRVPADRRRVSTGWTGAGSCCAPTSCAASRSA